MKFPLIVINFKTYQEATGRNAVALAKKFEKGAAGFEKNVALAVQAADIYRLSNAVSLPLFGQHADAIEHGKNTGFILLESLKENGASGTLINHSEHQLQISEIKKVVERCRALKMFSLVCVDHPTKIGDMVRLKPDAIAIEHPELIGTGIAISKVRPELISDSVRAAKEANPNMPVLCGAGINEPEDVRKAVELGCAGVLAASVPVKSKKPLELLSSYIKAAGISRK